MPLSSRTCELSTEKALEEVLILCREGSHVSPIVKLERGKEKKIVETYGQNTCELCKSVDLLSSSEKMLKESYLMDMPLKSWQTLRKQVSASPPALTHLVQF